MESTERCELSDVKFAIIGTGTGAGFVVTKVALGQVLWCLKWHWRRDYVV